MDQDFNIKEYIAILKRRYLYLLIPFVVLSAGAAVVVTTLPPLFVSTGVILIESPQISGRIVEGTIDSAAQERIETIRQRVMTRDRLLRIAEDHRVFSPEERANLSASEVVSRMRSQSGVSYISGGDRRSQSTIAFRVSFEHRDPRVAARVANEMVTMFMDENRRTRTRIATETTEFLQQEAAKLERDLVQMEDRIASYRQEHSSALPENLDVRLGMRERMERQIRELEREVKSYQEELRFLDIQIRTAEAETEAARQRRQAQIEAMRQQQSAGAGSEEAVARSFPELQKLYELRSSLAQARSLYSEMHPDVRTLKRQVDAEEERLLNEGGAIAVAVRKRQTEARLDRLRAGHEIGENATQAELEARIAELDAELAALTPAPSVTQGSRMGMIVPQDPSVFGALNVENIRTKMTVVEERIASLNAQKSGLETQLAEIEESIIQTPQVDRALRALQRDYANAQAKYNEIRAKAMQAQIAENVEQSSRAERFVLVEPPSVPDTPTKPDRRKLLAMGLALSLGAGMASLVGIEFIDGGIRGAGGLATAIGMAPMAAIPYISTVSEERRGRRRLILFLIAMFLAGIALLVAIHFLFMPLHELIYKVMDRFG